MVFIFSLPCSLSFSLLLSIFVSFFFSFSSWLCRLYVSIVFLFLSLSVNLSSLSTSLLTSFNLFYLSIYLPSPSSLWFWKCFRCFVWFSIFHHSTLLFLLIFVLSFSHFLCLSSLSLSLSLSESMCFGVIANQSFFLSLHLLLSSLFSLSSICLCFSLSY